MVKKQSYFILAFIHFVLGPIILNAGEMRIQPFPYPIEDNSKTVEAPRKTKKQIIVEKIKANPKLAAAIAVATIATIVGAGYGGVKGYKYYRKKKLEEADKLELLEKYLEFASQAKKIADLESRMIDLKNKGKKELIRPNSIMIRHGLEANMRSAPELTPDQWLKAIKDFNTEEKRRSAEIYSQFFGEVIDE